MIILESTEGRILAVIGKRGIVNSLFLQGQIDEIFNIVDTNSLHIRKIQLQLKEYFSGFRRHFDIPVNFVVGTNFQQKVWNELLKIPYGETRTYGEIASAIGKPKAARAVGSAIGKNPIPIIVPCHRVIAANGIGGYSGGIEKKKFLLNLEGVKI